MKNYLVMAVEYNNSLHYVSKAMFFSVLPLMIILFFLLVFPFGSAMAATYDDASWWFGPNKEAKMRVVYSYPDSLS